MIKIDIPMPKNCLECRFSWAGDSCTYCVAQCFHKPGGGYHLHKIKPTYHGYAEQMVWREATCPLIAVPELPAWVEYFTTIGLCEKDGDGYRICVEKLNQPMDPDIAQKLGVKPEEATP